MKNIKLSCIKFILYVYTTYIVEEWDLYTEVGKIFIYPCWVIRSFFIWLICPIFILEYNFKQSKAYKEYQKLSKSKEYQSQLSKLFKI